MKLAAATALFLIFAVGALEWSDDNGDFAQIMRGLATMALSAIALLALMGMD